YCVSHRFLSSSVAPRTDLAIPLVFEIAVSCLRSSRLFLRPYSPSSRSSSSSCSFRHGWRGVSNFFFGFRGSPKNCAYLSPVDPDPISSLLSSYWLPSRLPTGPSSLHPRLSHCDRLS